jgi:DNA-binding transcriptional ArsR family regulator
MAAEADIGRTAALFADPTRVTILEALLDGRALPPSELAAAARVSRPTVSEHLAKLLDAGLLAVERGGRNRYYRLAGPQVADALEALAVIAPPRAIRSLREANRADALSVARTCYGHLAGQLGVAIADALQERAIVRRRDDRFELGAGAPAALASLGIATARLPRRGGVVAHPCNDWSERRPHVGGSLGVALARRLFELGWIERAPQPRAVWVTERGRAGLLDGLGVRL